MSIIDELLDFPDLAAQKQFLEQHIDRLPERLAATLKEYADDSLRTDLQRSLRVARLLTELPEITRDPLHGALGLLAEANARSIGLGEYQRSLALYDQAAELYREHGQEADVARCKVGKVWSLACLGQIDQAIQEGEQAAQVLEAAEEWLPLAKLTMNLAAVYARQGNDRQSLALCHRAQAFYERLGEEGKAGWLMAEQNRAVLLRSLGRFQESIQASQTAMTLLAELGQKTESARAQQNLAITYFVLGRYNEALDLLSRARKVFQEDKRSRDLARVDLFICDCLIQLRRYSQVLEKCRQIRELFASLGARLEVGQAIVDEGVAFAGLRRFDEALRSLAEARQLFLEEGNPVLAAGAELEMATVQLLQGEFQECLATAQGCARLFQENQLPVGEAQAHLVAARAAFGKGQLGQAQRLAELALQLAQQRDLPSLSFQCHHLLGRVEAQRDRPQQALALYRQAIQELELLRGSLMMEYRADFLEDKQAVYEDAVRVSLDMGQVLQGMEYAERAKSRALLEMVAFRMELGIQARSQEDVPLVAELLALREERDRLYRRWESREAIQDAAQPAQVRQAIQQDISDRERRITELWHQLLIRNADYAREATLWQVRTEPPQPYLEPDTLLVEYFIAQGELMAFLVSRDGAQVWRLGRQLPQIQRLSQLLGVNLRTVPRSRPALIPSLRRNAEGVLRRLYRLLVEPFQDELAGYRKLILVPHGPLHYLPLQALHDGESYLAEKFQIGYLPGASLLRYCQEEGIPERSALVVGYSREGALPHALEEARSVARLFGQEPLLEEAASLARFQEQAQGCQVIHLSTHGVFRPDNPVFSGLTLADGQLTTLDIFGLRLDASLVTLSACETGRSVVAGGDELTGFMRAFLYAGASSLLLSLWAVTDRSTAQFMDRFYGRLVQGASKGAALQEAQRAFIHATGRDAHLAHPYFWAPFFLVGAMGPLASATEA